MEVVDASDVDAPSDEGPAEEADVSSEAGSEVDVVVSDVGSEAEPDASDVSSVDGSELEAGVSDEEESEVESDVSSDVGSVVESGVASDVSSDDGLESDWEASADEGPEVEADVSFDDCSDVEDGVAVELDGDGALSVPSISDGDSAGGKRAPPATSPTIINTANVPRRSVLRSGPFTEAMARVILDLVAGIKKRAVTMRIRPPRKPILHRVSHPSQPRE